MKLIIYLSLFSGLFLYGENTLLVSKPDIDNDTLVFEYGGDLWMSSIDNGIAWRLTSYEGYETNPEFSPDGRYIAYSGEYNADNFDVYVIPRMGGAPKRLTYHPADDYVVGWTPDGKYILFVSSRNDWKLRRLYRISPEGGLPERMMPFSIYEADYSGDGRKLAFNIRPARLEWKGYRGGRAPDIWLYDSELDTTYRITSWPGTEIIPQILGDKVYFLADKDGRLNLFFYDLTNRETEQLTYHYDFDIRFMNRGDNKIVYECGGRFYIFNPEDRSVDTVSVFVPDDKRFLQPHYEKVDKLIEFFSISPQGKLGLFNARGEIFTVPKKKGPVRNITKTSGIRERYPVWSPDGKWVAYISDETGENELYIRKPDGSGEPIQLTHNGDCYRYQPHWSPDSKKLLYTDSKYRLYYIDIDEHIPILIDTSNTQPISQVSWSPDSRWVAYVKVGENWFGSIYLYSLDNGTYHRITDELFDDYDVCFDPGGKYLYFISSRTFNPVFDNFSEFKIYPRAANICLITLQSDLASPFLPEEESEAEKKDKEETEEEKTEEKLTHIDLENIELRIITVPVPAGNYQDISAAKNKILYRERLDVEIAKRKYALHLFDMKEKEDNVIIKNIDDYTLSANGEYVIYKSNNIYGIIEVANKVYHSGDGRLKVEKMEMKIEPESELQEMFVDAWRLQRDYYYDPKMHGLDWNRQREKFFQFVPFIADRNDLTHIIAWLYSELGIDNIPVRYPDNPYKFLENKLGIPVKLQVSSEPNFDGAREILIKPISLRNERNLYYYNWVEENRKKVARSTRGRVGYVHVPNTATRGLEEFGKYFFSQSGKEGLIIDVRYNGGGWSPDMFMDYLKRRPLGMFITRKGKENVEPFVKFDNRLVCIINEYAGSGGDMFPYYFRELGLGPLLGKTTWGGLIATTGRRLMDGGGVATPVIRFKDLSGEWRIENEGVKPDIWVENHPDAIRKGKDLQLEKAIEIIKSKISAK
ncbi:hypothetical protein BXT86_03550 [candidate division WOR-3 bacterium 4484_100]|uniref:Tail specific protease domain-containing protein n=1 Tax=candidate division WOR-3 bacterium 4484_100 TaxID=1936077 RepID=A0A1V4QG58_UNCW3|nr:MAG: hypothetical protein BXT86_03550 [candidate division WOR-3 bacterium 4484_100]